MRIPYRTIILIFSLLFTSCSMNTFLGIENRPNALNSYRNPHDFCSICHIKNNPKDTDFVKDTPSYVCVTCHDYRENHHPISVRPSSPSTIHLPLHEGKIECLTCHEIHGGPNKTGVSHLLRGGPYADRRGICNQCHQREQFAKINPHMMLEKDGSIRKIDGKDVCLICHSVTPNPKTQTAINVRFRADIGFLCWRCHPPMPDPFFNTHYLVRPSMKHMDRIKLTEASLNVAIPLIPRGRITCSTCHNPHQAGVIQNKAAAKGANAKGKVRLPENPCSPCHLF